MMRALIVDDEPLAREELERLVTEVGGGALSIVAKCANAVEALQAIRRERPDVVFLDVQMPGVSGLELLAMMEDEIRPESVVFVTAHDEFAVEAFEKSATDYLLKPVQKERLAKTVERLRARRGAGAAAPALQAPEIKRVPCLAGRSVKLVPVAEIEFVKSSEAGVYVVCPQGEYYTELTLSVLEERARMLRCHKQYLVNIDRIDEINLAENSLAVIKTKSGNSVPVSRRHLARLREALGL